MAHFVFCHGFGFDVHFWERIAEYFSKEKCSFINLGYFNHREDAEFSHEQRIIGVGHSIGLSKLISMYRHFDCLIGLNSFINFLGSDPAIYKTRQKEVKALRSRFLKEPDFTLRRFYSRCGASALIECNDFSKLNLDLILSDLQWLEKAYNLPEVPTLILSADDDSVLPHTITSDNFSKQPWVKKESMMNAGHALGFKKPLEVYEKMMSFLDDRTA